MKYKDTEFDIPNLEEAAKAYWRKRILFHLVVFLLVFGATLTGAMLVGFPTSFGLAFGAALGLESVMLFLIARWFTKRTRQRINQAHFSGDENLRKRGGLALLVCSIGIVVHMIVTPSQVWVQTIVVMALFVLGSYGLFALLASVLLRGGFSHRFIRRWYGRLAGLSAIGVGAVFLLLFNFLGGIHWWYGTYVTAKKRAEVTARSKMLKSIQLTTIYDRNDEYLGLYTKRESDWARYYNDSALLKWKVSRAVMEAEGRVQRPAWWWRYLPDGETLQCEPFSIEAFLRVPYYFIKQRGRRVGGSTPALQAAKNILDFGLKRQGKGLLSKVSTKLLEEMPRSYIMCQSFTPREMMAVYMATLWAGKGPNYGLHRMSLYYFGTALPHKLTWNQSVVLAASLPNAGRLNPWYTEECWKTGKCKSKRQARVFKTWTSRINQLKARLRRMGIQVPKALPHFENKLGEQLRAVSRKWKAHDIHVRKWVSRTVPKALENWENGARIQLYYDRKLTVGQPEKKKPGLIDIAKQYIDPFREQIDELQIAFTLINSDTGHIISQYGGDAFVDMALAKKPVVGSTFKVMTSMIAHHWPDALPLLNQGRTGKNYRRFVYHPGRRSKGHFVRNSHKMPGFVDKVQALKISANIGFVFLSLRWTWFVEQATMTKILTIGLEQLYRNKRKLSPADAKRAVAVLIKDPKHLRKQLIKHFGYGSYVKGLRYQAAFESAKVATVRALINDPEVPKNELTKLIGVDQLHELNTAHQKVRETFHKMRDLAISRYPEGTLTLEQLCWSRELRMEMGLRYIIHLAQQVAGYDMKADHLVPVTTLTLGVNNATTQQLAQTASFVASGKMIPSRLLKVIKRGQRVQYKDQIHQAAPSPMPPAGLQTLRKAMSSVLQGGTASSAGRLLKRQFGASIFNEAGAKTGTVQNSKGVSCVGYVRGVAGAVTLSTPQNDSLKTYKVRSSWTRRLKSYKRNKRSWQKRLARPRLRASRARRYQRYVDKYTKRISELEEKIIAAKLLGKRFHKLRKAWKGHRKSAKVARKAARSARRRIYPEQRRSRRYQVYARRMNTKARSTRSKLQALRAKLPNAQDPKRRKSRTERRYEKRLTYYNKRYKYWIKKYFDSLKKQKQYKTRQAAMNKRYSDEMAKYRKSYADYRKISRSFYRSHQRWTLSSSKACYVLFQLLAAAQPWYKVEKERLAKQGPMVRIQIPANLNKPTVLRPIAPNPAATGASASATASTDAGSPDDTDNASFEPIPPPDKREATFQFKPLQGDPMPLRILTAPKKTDAGAAPNVQPARRPPPLRLKDPLGSSADLLKRIERRPPPPLRRTKPGLKVLQPKPRLLLMPSNRLIAPVRRKPVKRRKTE